jgi:hypothetical protein
MEKVFRHCIAGFREGGVVGRKVRSAGIRGGMDDE